MDQDIDPSEDRFQVISEVMQGWPIQSSRTVEHPHGNNVRLPCLNVDAEETNMLIIL